MISQAAIDERRVGKFTVHRPMWEDPEVYPLVLKFFLPIRVEAIFWDNCYEVTAYCDKFDPVPPGEMMPDYKPVWQQEVSGAVHLLDVNRLRA